MAGRRIHRWLGAVGLTSVLFCIQACTVGPTYVAPAPPPPSAIAAPTPSSADVAQGAAPASDWWKAFNSPVIDARVEAALAQNPDIAIARARLAQAHEAAVRAGAARYPAVSLSASVTRETTTFLPEGIDERGPAITDYLIGPSVSFDLDAFGGARRLRQARAAEAEAAGFEAEAARLTVCADVVRAVIETARARARLDILDQLAADDRQTVESVQRLVDVRRKTIADLEAARSQLAADEALVPAARQQLAAATTELALLTARTPGEAEATDLRLPAIADPAQPPNLLPAELVRRRPDVRAAEARLRAANAKVGVAVARQYPDLSLVGFITQESLDASHLFTPAASGGLGAIGIVAPLFQGGALRSDVRAARAGYQESAALYRRTVLTAVGQVSNVLQALAHDDDASTAYGDAVTSADRALAAAQARYALSHADLLQVLTARQALGRARLRIADARAQRLLDMVQLYAALGGGGVK